MGYSTPQKIVASLIIGAVFFVSVFVVSLFGHFSGKRRANSELSPVLAKVVYDFAAKREYQRLADSDLCTSEVVTRFQEFEKKYGRIRSFKVIEATPAVMGIPVVVDVDVERTQGTFREYLVSSVSSPYDQLQQSHTQP